MAAEHHDPHQHGVHGGNHLVSVDGKDDLETIEMQRQGRLVTTLVM